MFSKKSKKIMYLSEDAATFKTGLEGWVSNDGRFFGDNEHLARWNGCTHMECECGTERSKHYNLCDGCRSKDDKELHEKRRRGKWDGEAMLFSHKWGTYFSDYNDMEEQLAEHNEHEAEYPEDRYTLEQMQIVICEPCYMHQVDSDYWQDCLPEDECDLPTEMQAALDNLNEVISKQKVASWQPSKIALEFDHETV